MRAQTSSNKRDEFLSRVRKLAPLIEAHATASEAAKTLAPEVVEAFKQSDLFWLLVPSSLGGVELDAVAYVDVLENVSCSDGATGWTLMANALALGLAAAYCRDAAAEAIFGGASRPIAASVLGRFGKAKPVDGGFLASGRYTFGSGSEHSNWFAGAVELHEGDQPKTRPDGGREFRIGWFPRERVELVREWNPVGLVGTGSFEYVVAEHHLPEAFVHEYDDKLAPRRPGTNFELGMGPIGAIGHGAIALGLMKRALQEVAQVAPRKKRLGSIVGENPMFLAEFTDADATYRAARALLHSTLQEAQQAIASRGQLTPSEGERIHQSVSWIYRVGFNVVRSCTVWAGSEGLRAPGAIERCLRDMLVAETHPFADRIWLSKLGPSRLAERRDETRRAEGGKP